MNNQQPPPSGRRKRRKQPPQQPRYYLPNNHYYRQQPPPNPNLKTQNQSSSSLLSSNSNSNVISIEKVDEAVVTARRVLVAGGEHVSSWKVSRAAHVTLGGGLDSLGVEIRHVPSFNRLITLEHKINGYINYFVEVWKITTLYDLEMQICKSEGVRKFEELELGPLIRHPLIVLYFSVKSDSTRAFRISGQEVISFLINFMDANKRIEVKGDELLDFIAKKRSVDSKEKLHVRIQSLGLYIGWILQARSLENAKYKKCLSDVGSKIMELPVLMSQKKPLEENFCAVSEHIKLSLEDNNEDIESNHEDETCLPSQSKNSSQDMKSSEQFIGSSSLDNILVKKRKSDAINCTSFLSHKILKRDGVGQSSPGTKISNKFMHDTFQNSKQQEESVTASEGIDVTTMNNQQPPPSGRRKRRKQRPQQPPLPCYYLPNNHYYRQQPPPNPNLNTQNQSSSLLSSNSNVISIEKIDEAVVTVRRALIAGGEHVSSWKVSRAAHVTLGGLDSLGVEIRHVPSFNRLITLEDKINGYINCFVEVWKITTLYDLETQICKSEGVRKFEELELGPLIRHPLIVLYFSVKSDSTRAFRISGQEVISYLVNFMDTNKCIKVKGDELLDFIAKKRSVDSKEKLHVRIQSLGLYIGWILQARSLENAKYKKCLSDVGSKIMELPVLMSQKKPLKENLSVVSDHIKLSSEYNNEDIESNHEDETCLPSQSKNSSQDMKSSEQFIGSPSLDNILVKKRKSDAIDCTAFLSRKIPKRDGVLSHHLLVAPVAQASHDISETENLTFQNVEKQLPSKLDKEGSPKALKDVAETNKNSPVSESVNSISETHRSSKDAIEAFLKAPMLSDLNTWSNWDVLFAPSLGPLATWLSNETTPKELLCLATKSGNVIRVDHTATVDSFLEASSQGSSFQTALNLLSLYALYNGERYVPTFLLKCQAEQAFKAIVKDTNQFDNGKSTASIYILDCLTYIPAEFRCFATDLLLSGFRLVVKDAPSAILSECRNTEQRVMLHELGLSLGIMEWKNDYHTFSSTQFRKASEFDQVNDKSTSHPSADVENEESKVVNDIGSRTDISSDKGDLDHEKHSSKSNNEEKAGIMKRQDFRASKAKAFSTDQTRQKVSEGLIENNVDLIIEENPAKVILKENEATGTHMNFGFKGKLDYGKNIILSNRNTGFSAFTIPDGPNAILVGLSNKDQQHSVTKVNKSELPSNGDPINKPNATSFNYINRDQQSGLKKVKYSELPCNTDRIIEQTSASKVPSLILEEDACLKDIPDSGICRDVSVINVGLKGKLDYGKNVFSSDMNAGISAIPGGSKANSSEKDQLSWGTVTPRQVITGSAAELLAFKSAKLGEKPVRCDAVAEGKDSSNKKDSAKKIIELIRREEFGLNPDTSAKEDNTLKKQHARLGRALQCLSQELYSQDSHFLLELVQNADDNVYPCDVEPTLNFILQETGVVVLNNEQGFSAENIKALCDVGSSTKKEHSAGYIGKKGIGFKSVFRVTDAPEIHSNGFHIKFDVSDGQIGFVLPTIIPPCRIDSFSKLVSLDTEPMDEKHWNTCIILPFRSKKNEAFSVENLISMFSNLHPSLLLFLCRLKCIRFRNLLNDSLTVMRKEVIGNGIVSVSTGKEKMAWFVKSRKLKASHMRHDVQTTEISVAFMLEDLNNGNYISKLDQQPVFAFLPLRNYGLKFIIQADFTLPSSREEVDGNSPWNKWLLSQFPNLFVSAELSFCSLPYFKENPAKGVSVFMSFVPLGGEVHGFFSQLPHKILSKLLKSNCLLLEGDRNEWVPPSKVLRNWTEKTRSLLSDSLIKEHLGLGYLNKDIVLTDSLARALGIKECGPTILIQLMTSLCRAGSLKSMGLKWLSSWLNTLYLMTVNGNQSDSISSLCQLPFIPLMDGSYASIRKGTIWLHTNTDHCLEAFKKLYLKLKIVNPALFNDSHVENITQLLYKVGVQQLSAHDVLKRHILPVVSVENFVKKNKKLMIEYLSFIMFHLETTCSECLIQKEHILSKLRNSAFISTNHGYKRLVDVPIHFSKEFGNPIDMSKLVVGTDTQWFEIDISYLKHPVFKSLPDRTLKWRKFLQELGVTDFVKIVKVEKRIGNISDTVLKKMMLDDGCISSGSIVKDWDSQELSHLLSHVSSTGDREKGKYLLELLDTLWDDYFSDKSTGFCIIKGQYKPFKASVIRILHGVRWLASSMDDQLQFPKDLFHNCETVHAVLGDNAPYCIPKVNNVKLLNDIGLKDTVNLDDALSVLEVWWRSEKPFRASISQMLKLYTYIWNEMSISKQKIVESLHSRAFIFVPYSFNSTLEVVSGLFLSPSEVYWHDSIFSSMEQTKLAHPQFDQNMTHCSSSKMLCNVYPGLHYFFVNEFGVAENPPLLSYLQSLIELSTRSLPSQAAKTVFQVFQKWSVGLDCGFISSDDIDYLKKSMEEKEMKILPTVQDKWVSFHQSPGLICWCDDEQLRKEFMNAKNIDFLCLGDLNNEEKQLLQDKVSVLFRRLGIPPLSEVVTREAVYYDLADNSYKTSLVNWALPYAQRYIFSIHPTEYSELKLSGFDNLHFLQIVVVEKLLYKNVIKKYGIESSNLCECNCLLQDNVLYATHKSDSHPLFMELSHLLLAGIHELHLANFLYMITTMAKSGFTEEKMEFFITNSQKLLTLPSGESQWSLVSTSSPEEGLNPPEFTTAKKFEKKSSWPPVHWKPAPRFEDVSKTKDVTPAGRSWDVTKGLLEIGDDWIIKESPALTTTSVILEEDESLKDRSESVINRDIVSSDTDVGSRDQSHYGKSVQSSDMNAGSSTIITYEGPALTTTSMILEEDESSKDQSKSAVNKDVVSTDVGFRDLSRYGKNIQSPDMNSASSAIIRYDDGKHTFSPQHVTGRTGERVAFKYYSENLGDKIVKWVNEVKESGLPYDIVVEGKDNSKEYIEVKATSLARKDWFSISVREWQFAVEKGDSFSIARVVLSHGKLAQIVTYRNPVELCQSRQLQLCIRSAK